MAGLTFVLSGGSGLRGDHHLWPGAHDRHHGQRAETEQALRRAGRRDLHHGLGNQGRTARPRLDESAGSFGPDTWVGFVSSGDPGWDHYTTKDRATMVFNTHNTLVNDPHGDERQLWDGLR